MQSNNQQPGGQGKLDGQLPNGEMGDLNNQFSDLDLASSPSEIVTGTTTNSALSLSADENNATTFVMSDSESSVKIDSAGTYIVTGNCSDGNITVKKNTTGVILILRNLTLTSTTGATVSCNKGSEAKIIIEGSVNLTDAENPSDEDSSDSEVADAFDGAALKVKDGANAYLTGPGTLTINASSCKNGGEAGIDYDGTCYIADGTVENLSGISGPDNMMGQNGQQMPQNNQPQMNGQQGPQNNQPQMREMGNSRP